MQWDGVKWGQGWMESLFSHSVVSNSLQPHGLQHARLPCPSPSLRACSNSYPSNQWCHPTISSSVCQEPAWGTPPMAKVMRKEALAYAKVGSSLRKTPVPEHLPPKPESAYFTVLCFHLHLWLYRGLSPTTSLGEGVNLQLQSIKIPGRDKSVSTYKLLWRFSSLPEQVHPTTCDCSQPPNHERHEML